MDENLKDLKDELARVRAREQRYKTKIEADITELEEQIKAMKENLECAEIQNIRMKDEIKYLKKQCIELKTQYREARLTNNIQILAQMVIRYIFSAKFENFNRDLSIWCDPAVDLLDDIEKRGLPINKPEVYAAIARCRSPIPTKDQFFDEISTLFVNVADCDDTPRE